MRETLSGSRPDDIDDRESLKCNDVVELTGFTTAGFEENEWKTCLSRHRCLVGTADIFRKLLLEQCVLSYEEISLLVLDECHHARKKLGWLKS